MVSVRVQVRRGSQESFDVGWSLVLRAVEGFFVSPASLVVCAEEEG